MYVKLLGLMNIFGILFFIRFGYGYIVCDNGYKQERKLIENILDEQYNITKLEKEVTELIIIMEIGNIGLRGRSENNIIKIWPDTCDDINELIFVFHHEMSHFIRTEIEYILRYFRNLGHSYYSGKEFINKIRKSGEVLDYFSIFNINYYVGDDYINWKRRLGFVSEYSMYDLEEDIAETYAEYMTNYYLRFYDLVYDDIIIKKVYYIEIIFKTDRYFKYE